MLHIHHAEFFPSFGKEGASYECMYHVDYKEQSAVQSATKNDSKCNNCTLEELAILKELQKNPSITQKEDAGILTKSYVSERILGVKQMNNVINYTIDQWVENFINVVDIGRINVSCEIEVCKEAMDFYKKYPCYECDKWEIVKFQNSVNAYNSYDETKRKNYKDKEYVTGYKGAHLLVNKQDNAVLTADILTEIKSPVNKIINNDVCILDKGVKGPEIIDLINNKGENIFDSEIAPYVYAFAFVYYWIGNMLPVPKNPMRLNDRGTWRNKILFLNGSRPSETELKNSWGEWDLPENWESDFFLQDMFNNGKVKPFYKGLEDEKEYYFSKRSGYKQSEWFLNNTKLIIQRSYRIYTKFQGNWASENEKHKKCVQRIFNKVFSEAGFSDEELQGLSAELF